LPACTATLHAKHGQSQAGNKCPCAQHLNGYGQPKEKILMPQKNISSAF
jgi:hypothetical protein